MQLEIEEAKNQNINCALEDPNILGPVSLYNMVKFFALNFYSLAYWLAKLETVSKNQQPEIPVPSKFIDWIHETMNNMEKECSVLGLKMSILQIQRIRSIFTGSCSNRQFNLELQKLHERIFDELGNSWMFCLAAEKERYYREPWLTFGQQIVEVFPALSKDIEEAGKCYGAQRNTACVFHLMRIMEVGLHELAGKLNVSTTIPSWDGILKKIDTELEKRRGDKTQDWKDKESVMSEAASHLRTVKTVWRNPTMHIESKYTDEEALEIYDAVRVFMRHLATKIQE